MLIVNPNISELSQGAPHDPNDVKPRPARLGLGASYIPHTTQKTSSTALTKSLRSSRPKNEPILSSDSEASSSDDETCSRFAALSKSKNLATTTLPTDIDPPPQPSADSVVTPDTLPTSNVVEPNVDHSTENSFDDAVATDTNPITKKKSKKSRKKRAKSADVPFKMVATEKSVLESDADFDVFKFNSDHPSVTSSVSKADVVKQSKQQSKRVEVGGLTIFDDSTMWESNEGKGKKTVEKKRNERHKDTNDKSRDSKPKRRKIGSRDGDVDSSRGERRDRRRGRRRA
ncbi:hypothetical protein P9112_003009 [Eukaryota sp. TZLM1-RC]